MVSLNETATLWSQRLRRATSGGLMGSVADVDNPGPDCCWLICDVCCWVVC